MMVGSRGVVSVLGAVLAVVMGGTVWFAAQSNRESGTPPPLRLYVLDGGVLESDPARYQLTAQDVGTTQLSIAAYLVVHPKGVLLWDTGAVADGDWTPTGRPSEQRLVLADGQERRVTIERSLVSQLSAAGFAPSAVTHLALSHYHWDHTANANVFAGATWLARPADRDAMFAPAPGASRPATYAALRNSRTTFIRDDEHDVFGDGTITLKSAPGHTEGHQVLLVKLPRTGPVLLSGDLYHYSAERALGRMPTFENNPDETRAARRRVDAFLTTTGAQLWIQHELPAHRQLRKAPEYYD